MTIAKALNWGASYLGQTFQEVRDIYKNGCILYKHGDLPTVHGKVLPTADCQTALQVQELTQRSQLFLFRDYTFQIHPQGSDRVVVEILPATENPSSLTRVFAQESLRRLVKGVAVVGITVLTSPAWGLALFGTSRCCRNPVSGQLDLTLPPEPADSHVTPDDIRRIGMAVLGYRHVSTEELAQHNAKNGFCQGCSLNISFCNAENLWNPVKFKDLDLRLEQGENCDALIGDYEAAITEFIRNSIFMDHDGPAFTYGDLFATLQRSRFMIVRTGWLRAADADNYGGLGRMPKENVGPEGITLLRRIAREDLKLDHRLDRKRFTSAEEQESVGNYIASHYRRELLRYLREDFDPRQFEQNLTVERIQLYAKDGRLKLLS